jgi:N-acyl-D-amino-acid deacylase
MKIISILVIVSALSVPASAQVPDFTPKTPLLGALLHNDSAEAKRLLEAGADPNDGRFIGFPPVLLATLRQDLELVRLMAAKGADLTATDPSGSTALMWAAFNEYGDAQLVQELLRLGADPSATNKAGESALSWAQRRGDTPAVAALRTAGASDSARVKEAVEKSVALLQRSGAQFTRMSGCYSCHHQLLPQMALGVARTRGLQIDEPAARQQIDSIVTILKRVSEEARRNRDRIPDPPISVSYTLLSLGAAKYPADDLTAALAEVVAAWQGEDGAFHPLPAIRPPMESNAFAGTALSLRALQLYGSQPQERIARAIRWLSSATPRNTEERAMQLLGLAWGKATAQEIGNSLKALLADQRADGGWGQLPSLETDAYATGQALVALETAGYAVSSAAYQRGLAFLMRTQHPDGSWLVRTRTFPVQPKRDSGFPHGDHQWISAAGTSWAAMALALAIPPTGGTGSSAAPPVDQTYIVRPSLSAIQPRAIR